MSPILLSFTTLCPKNIFSINKIPHFVRHKFEGKKKKITFADAAVMDGEGTLGRGHGNGGRGLRRQRSLEWRERRGYGPSAQSSSDDEENSRHAVGAASVSSAGRGARSPGQVFASLLAQQYGSE